MGERKEEHGGPRMRRMEGATIRAEKAERRAEGEEESKLVRPACARALRPPSFCSSWRVPRHQLTTWLEGRICLKRSWHDVEEVYQKDGKAQNWMYD